MPSYGPTRCDLVSIQFLCPRLTLSIHHERGPSSASRWLNCGGSLTYPNTGEAGPEALEGTRLHAVASEHLERVYHGNVPSIVIDDQTLKDLEILQPYYDFVDEAIANLNNPQIHIELYCPPTDIKDFGGTIDVLLIDDDLGWVIDLKTGYKFVSAEDNEQLLCYTLLGKKRFPQLKQFRQSIVQPKVNYSATHQCSLEELIEFEQRIRGSSKADFTPGAHCEFCPGLGDCPVADRNLVQIMSYAKP